MEFQISEKAVLQKFAQYVFRREAGEIRDDLHESIVEMVLYLKLRPLDPKTIKNEINRQLNLNFDQFFVNSAINRLVDKGLVKQTENGKFYLTETRKRAIGKTIEERRKTLNKIEKAFISEYHANIRKSSNEEDKIALSYLYKFLLKLFQSDGNLLIGVLRYSKEDAEHIKHYRPPKKLLEDTTFDIGDLKFKEAIHKSIITIFKKREVIKFLNIVGRNYLYYQILNLDPECRFFQKEVFSEKILLLGTNFIIKLLLMSASGHRVAAMCTSLSRKLGIQLRYTKRTKQEFLDQLRQSNRRFRGLKLTKLSILSSLDDDFIASYALEKQKNLKLTWSDFFYKYKSFETILKKWGITEYKEALPLFEVYHEKTRQIVTSYVLTCAQQVSKLIKSVPVAEHDSYHLLLVRKLREEKPSHALGPRVWFLTFDNSLICVDQAINDVMGSKYDPPSSVECWVWIELILPFFGSEISNNTSLESFSERMKTQFSLIPARISTKKLIAIQTPKINFDLFSKEQIQAILSDQFVEEYWSKYKNAKKTEPQMVKKYEQEMQKRAEIIAEKILKRKSQTEIITRIISAAMAILAFVFTLYCAIVGKLYETVILGFFSIIFITIAVGYSKIELAYEKTRAKLRIVK